MDSQDPKLFHWQYAERKGNDFVIRGRSLFFLAVLIGVVLLVSLLVLYARWVCLYDIPRLPNNSSPPADLRPPDRSQGLDQTTIKALPISLYRAYDTVSVENECCICLGVFADGDKVKVLPRCHHCFHSECVDRWLKTRSSCPLCRNYLRTDSVLASIETESTRV